MSEAITKALDEFEIQAITTAYEQGFGHAWRTELSNPYPEGAKTRTAWQYGRDAGQRQTPQPTPSPQPAESALEKYRRLGVDAEETGPIERLRAFCSFAMNGQDWLDVEPFFGALRESPQPAVPVVSDERLLLEWDRVSHINEAGSRRLAFARAILALRPAGAPMTPEQLAVLRFCWGSGTLDGLGFGDKHPELPGNFWWRNHLAEAFPGITAKAEGAKP